MTLNFRKFFIVLILLLAFGFTNSHSAPVEPGQWFTLTLTDGSKVRAELYGDEWFTFYLDLNKTPYIQVGRDTYQQITNEQLTNYLAEVHAEASKHRSRRLASPLRQVGIQKDTNLFRGTKKGLVLLVQFQDVKFDETIYPNYNVDNVNALFQRIINERGFHADLFPGSVKDYFLDQSRGVFTLDFDVVGPLTLSQNRAFYGGNRYIKNGDDYTLNNKDARRATFAYESILAAEAAGVDFSQYDWDDDGEVEQVFILYAGQGQADGGSDECIWPHMEDDLYNRLVSENNLAASGNYYYYDGSEYKLFEAVDYSAYTDYNGISLDGKYVKVYACSQELASRRQYNAQLNQDEVIGTQICGIGTFCHEFSHCLGLPDTYDTSSKGHYGMKHWDLMDSGNYNGSNNGAKGYRPAGYTAYERWFAGWLTPTVLDSPQHIVNMKPLGGTPDEINNCGDAYIIYARGNDIKGEYYILENRQKANWDKSLPWHGLLIYHIDYDETAWTNTRINNTDHERMRIFQAEGNTAGYLEMDAYPYNPDNLVGYVRDEFGTTASEIVTTINTQYSDKGVALNATYNDALTASSTPAAIYYNGDNTAEAFNGNEITEIRPFSDEDHSVSFMFRKPAATTASHSLALDENVTESQSYGKETDSNLYTSVTLNRTFTKFDTWSTMWLPFSLSYEELKNAFGENVEIAFFNGVNIDGEGHHIVDFTSRTNGTQAFVPFLIKISSADLTSNPSCAGPYTFNYVSVGSSDNTPQSVKTGGTFVGTTIKGDIPTGAWFISDNTFYKSVGKSTSRAYRAYFTFTDEIDTSVNVNVKQVNTLYDDVFEQGSSKLDGEYRELHNATTRIDGIEVSLDSQTVPASATIYTLSGQRIASGDNALHSLPRGIYIVNGHKYIKK